MRNFFYPLLVLVAISSMPLVVHAESSEFFTAIGTVEKFEKEVVTISVGEKPKKTLELKVTGTSTFNLLAPQNRAGKTVLTQRQAESKDLMPHQSIAVIYGMADKDHVLLTAVIKAVDKEKK